MSTIKVIFEIGHEASIRTKKTPEGFTHDWEVFVKGIDSADLSLFVDKVVFQLHETFPKPKRVVKEAPFSVKESGYAGFNLPIEIYLKNREEPKKIKFNYDLHLQQSGPPIRKTQKEKYVFNNPSEEFKRKLVKGGGLIVPNANLFAVHPNIDHERSRDSYTEEKPQQLIGKPKLSGDLKKHKTKEHRLDDLPRPSNSFVTLFGPPIHKTSRVSPDPKKPSPNPKVDKIEKEKLFIVKEKTKTKHESKEKDENKYRDEKTKSSKDEKEKSKEEKKSKSHHKERESSKDKNPKRPAERPPSPAPPMKKAAPSLAPPSPKSNMIPVMKEDAKLNKYADTEIKNKSMKSESHEIEKKIKKDKKSHDKDKESKKDHKREKESKLVNPEKEVKIKETSIKEIPSPIKEKEKLVEKKIEKPFNKFSIDNMLKDPSESKHKEGSKHKDKGDKERKHKHKKKDKKRDESKEKSKDSNNKEKKHKHEKHSHKDKYSEIKEIAVEKTDIVPVPREIDKVPLAGKSYKEKERSLLTISPISVDTSSQSSSKSSSKKNSNKLNLRNDTHSCSSNSDSEVSLISEDENMSVNSESNSKSSKLSAKIITETPKQETSSKVEKHNLDKASSPCTSQKAKNKEKSSKHEAKLDKKSKKKKGGPDDWEVTSKMAKTNEDEKSKRVDNACATNDSNIRTKVNSSPRVKTDTKVQDDGVSSSLSDHPLKCDSPLSEDTSQAETNRKQISPDYMLQLKELQQRIMTIQSNDELERVVSLIALTGKYEVTKKTFDFDLCLLDPSTVQQLQELIGYESRA